MESIRSSDADIVYESLGQGPPLLLLHPFPVHHEFWKPAVEFLSNYRIILPDLRGHGDSGIGDGPATMAKHADDLSRVLDHAGVGRAPMVGVSIGGYALFEFWRRFRNRVSALAFACTKASPDTPEARAGRLRTASEVLERGVGPFVDSTLPKLLGATTQASRPDLLANARAMAMKMSPQDVSQVQQGMAERPDSVPTLKTIDVPTLIIAGHEDVLIPLSEAELMRANISSSRLAVIPQAGHFAPFERPTEVGRLLRQFLDANR
jgi:pimeloyl-ACP methyl ester carboxylesterase